MYEKSTNNLSATTEVLALYMNLNKRKVSEFESDKVKIMDDFINLNKSKFKNNDLVFAGKLKK
jgi:acyl-CoA thioester hydrolase